MKAPFFHGALARLGMFPFFFLRVSCRLVFSLLPILSSFVFFFSPSLPSFLSICLLTRSLSLLTRAQHFRRARFIRFCARELPAVGWAIRPAFAPRALRRWRNRCFARRKRGAARRGGRASVPPPGRPMRGFDKRASRAMIRPSLLRCLRKAQAFGRRWG